MLLRVFGLCIALALVGCNQQLEQFVSDAGPKREEGASPPALVTSELDKLKRSPGAVRASGGGLSLRAHITATEQQLVGSGVSARVGVGAIQMR